MAVTMNGRFVEKSEQQVQYCSISSRRFAPDIARCCRWACRQRGVDELVDGLQNGAHLVLLLLLLLLLLHRERDLAQIERPLPRGLVATVHVFDWSAAGKPKGRAGSPGARSPAAVSVAGIARAGPIVASGSSLRDPYAGLPRQRLGCLLATARCHRSLRLLHGNTPATPNVQRRHGSGQAFPA